MLRQCAGHVFKQDVVGKMMGCHGALWVVFMYTGVVSCWITIKSEFGFSASGFGLCAYVVGKGDDKMVLLVGAFKCDESDVFDA